MKTDIPDISSLRLLRLTCKHCASTAACCIADSDIFALWFVSSLAELLPSCTSLGILSSHRIHRLQQDRSSLHFLKLHCHSELLWVLSLVLHQSLIYWSSQQAPFETLHPPITIAGSLHFSTTDVRSLHNTI